MRMSSSYTQRWALTEPANGAGTITMRSILNGLTNRRHDLL